MTGVGIVWRLASIVLSAGSLPGALLSCVDKKVTKEATGGGAEQISFRHPGSVATLLPGNNRPLPGPPSGATLKMLDYFESFCSNLQFFHRTKKDPQRSTSQYAYCTKSQKSVPQGLKGDVC